MTAQTPPKWAQSTLRMIWASQIACAVLGPVAAPADPSPISPIRETKMAMGGDRWNRVEAITAEGEKTSFGLTGKYHSSEDLRSGLFVRRAEFGLFGNAEGFDKSGRWRMDNSGQVHSLDSDEANTVAVTEAYLARRGYLFPESAPATFMTLPTAVEDGQTFDRIEAAPAGGRAMTLWIARSDHLLDRAVIQLSTAVETIHYRNYRSIGGLVLPFEIETSNADEAETGIAKISEYRLEETASDGSFSRPSSSVTDARIRSGGPSTSAPFSLDPMSNFPIIWASINGRGPFPFILDTGGHDILTPAAVTTLGLTVTGRGVSFGAGAGSTPTSFTKVDSLVVGDAELRFSPFVVLQMSLGQSMGAAGKPAPVAGIIGLELFERFVVTLDYRARALTLRPLDGAAYHPTTAPGVPIRFTSDMPDVRALLNGHAGWFAVDSGNNTDLILSNLWAKDNEVAAITGSNDNVAGGESVGGSLNFRSAPKCELTIGATRVPNLAVLIAGENMGSLSSRSDVGNIGETVLSRFNRVTFDYRRELMFLEDD